MQFLALTLPILARASTVLHAAMLGPVIILAAPSPGSGIFLTFRKSGDIKRFEAKLCMCKFDYFSVPD